MTRDNYRSMTEIAYEHILETVHAGRLKPGDKLVIEEVTKELNMSRVPIREAVKQLASEGILILDHHKSPLVREISLSDVKEIYQVRKLLEPRAAVLALDNFSADDLETVNRLRERTEKAVLKKRMEKYIVLNRDFHFFIYHRSNNKWLVKTIESLWFFARWVNVATLFENNVTDSYLASHEAICEALKQKDKPRLEQVCAGHLEDALEVTLNFLSRIDQQAHPSFGGEQP
ncbi:MAG: GntR family transcriptional regulator [Deltaproteobacteria bacterium]|nr:GntR family transcriptional regulator [Deltaproteobacteria bacterium]